MAHFLLILCYFSDDISLEVIFYILMLYTKNE
jgi:hypothetical protein